MDVKDKDWKDLADRSEDLNENLESLAGDFVGKSNGKWTNAIKMRGLLRSLKGFGSLRGKEQIFCRITNSQKFKSYLSANSGYSTWKI